MRRRTQRILISLLAFFIAWFAMANAYTFEVINWSPFWVLNLEKLILKQKPNSTWIILDWKEYTIKIDPNHETEDWWIWVDTICDESWVNCKKVSELWIWGWGAIVIDGDAENFCFKKDDTTLICDNNFLKRLIESWWLGWSINIDGQDKNYCYRLRETNTLYCDNSDIPGWNGSTPGNGKITIIQWSNSRNFNLNDSGDQEITLSNGGGTTSGAIAYWSGEYICVKNWDNLMCNKAKLWELKPDKRCTFDGTSINCTEDTPGSGNANNPTIIITQWWVEKWRFTLNQTSDKTIPLDAGWNGPTISWNSWQRCKYICDKTEWQGWKQVCVSWHVACYESEPTCQWSCNEWWAWMLSGSAWWRCRYGAIVNGTTISWNMWEFGWNIKTWIICTEPAPSWDSLWQSKKITANGATSSENLLTPKNTNQDLYLDGDIWNDGAITIKTLWASNAARENTVSIYQHWVAIWELPNKTAGLWVHGPISVGKFMLTEEEEQTASRPGQCQNIAERNTISIYASWAAWTDNFEILWSKRILIWVRNSAYLYFQWDWSKNIWINTQNMHAMLNVDWSIKIGSCANNNLCNSSSVWEIKYFTYWNTWYFVWCRYRSWSAAVTNINAKNYEWVDLTNWQRFTNIQNSCVEPNPPYSASVYQTQAELWSQIPPCS